MENRYFILGDDRAERRYNNMKKTILAMFVFSVLLVSVMGLAIAVKPNGPSAYNGLNRGNSDVRHLELYEKDSDWNPVIGGAWGKLTFDDDSFVFNGHGLQPGESYSLLDNAEWGVEVEVEATGIADEFGNLHLSGDSLIDGGDSGKVWLVLSDDVSTHMTAWNPSEYLFEYNLI